MLRLLSLSVLCSVAMAMSTTMPTSTMDFSTTTAATTTTAMAAKVLYDFKHHKAMIVKDDGCYEYHMNHQDVVDAENDATRLVLEARMMSELAMATHTQETGHHHIDHMTQEIRTACASIPVYQFDTA